MNNQIDSDKLKAEAESYSIQAQQILNELQINVEVYGSNSASSGANPANVELALKFIERSIEYFPMNPIYLNTKALLLAEGQGNIVEAIALLKRANEIDPRDINISNNLEVLSSASTTDNRESNISSSNVEEAEEYAMQAQFILDELQINLEVYGSNSLWSGATPANVDLAIQYIDRSLEYIPDCPNYLNTKALLLAEGKGAKKAAVRLLEIAHELSPRDINIENNLNSFKRRGLFG